MNSFWIVLAVIFVIAVIFIALYNRIIALVQRRKNAFSDIDVQLKYRHDLVPNLVETVKGYAAHESTVFQAVTEARASAMQGGKTISERAKAESVLGQALVNLMAVAENYPDLKANENFLQLQNELSDIENKLAAARRFFNNATNEYNTAIQQFPGVIVARMFGYGEEDFFDLGDGVREQLDAAPDVSFG